MTGVVERVSVGCRKYRTGVVVLLAFVRLITLVVSPVLAVADFPAAAVLALVVVVGGGVVVGYRSIIHSSFRLALSGFIVIPSDLLITHCNSFASL